MDVLNTIYRMRSTEYDPPNAIHLDPLDTARALAYDQMHFTRTHFAPTSNSSRRSTFKWPKNRIYAGQLATLGEGSELFITL